MIKIIIIAIIVIYFVTFPIAIFTAEDIHDYDEDDYPEGEGQRDKECDT